LCTPGMSSDSSTQIRASSGANPCTAAYSCRGVCLGV
jgi:hypothetical protein